MIVCESEASADDMRDVSINMNIDDDDCSLPVFPGDTGYRSARTVDTRADDEDQSDFSSLSIPTCRCLRYLYKTKVARRHKTKAGSDEHVQRNAFGCSDLSPPVLKSERSEASVAARGGWLSSNGHVRHQWSLVAAILVAFFGYINHINH